jgi:hypothetical protein
MVNPAVFVQEPMPGVMLSTVMQDIDAIASSERVEKDVCKTLDKMVRTR